jgi:hypothetical protein
VLNPEYLAAAFPDSEVFQNPNGAFYRLFAGLSSGMLYTLFFSVLPQVRQRFRMVRMLGTYSRMANLNAFCPGCTLKKVFKVFANFEGSSSSIPRAENHALRFYWYFMLLTAFTGSTLAQMFFDGFVNGTCSGRFMMTHSDPQVLILRLFRAGSFEGELKATLENVARTIPTQQAPVWLNWILVRTGTTLPMMYLFQFNTWLYGWLRMKCLNRAMRGG